MGCDTDTHCRDLRHRSKRAVESRAQRSVLRSAAGNSQCVVIGRSGHNTIRSIESEIVTRTVTVSRNISAAVSHVTIGT